jgi:molecular chaperone GrpE
VNERKDAGPGAAAPAEGGEPGGAGGFADLESTVRAQSERIDELTRAYAGLLEDNKAFRQRVEREKERVVEAEKSRLAQGILESHEDLERAMLAARPGAGPGRAGLENLREGVALTLASMEKRIAEMGVTRIEVLGMPYDPRTAEAIDLVVVADPAQEGVVLEEFRPGWRIGDRILRPARVRVGRLAQA